MGNDVTATFAGDTQPMERAMDQLKAAMAQSAATIEKSLTFTPKMDPGASLAARNNIELMVKQWVKKSPEIPVDIKLSKDAQRHLDEAFARLHEPADNPLTRSLSRGAQAASKPRGGLQPYQVQNIAYQVADVAVEAQGGISFAKILGQQGSQALGVLGPMGAVAGAALAIGAALTSAGEKGTSAFATITSGAQAARAEMEKLSVAGTGSELEAALEKIGERRDEATKARESLSSFSQFAADHWKDVALTAMNPAYLQQAMHGGTGDAEESRNKVRDMEGQIEKDRLTLGHRLMEQGDAQVQIAELRAKAGEQNTKEAEREADAIERQLKLSERLALIHQSKLPDNMQRYLGNNERTIAAAADAKDARDADREDREKRQRYEHAGDRFTGMFDQISGSGNEDLPFADRIQSFEALQQKRREGAEGRGYTLDKDGVTGYVQQQYEVSYNALKHNNTGGSEEAIAKAEKALQSLKEYQQTEKQWDDQQKQERERDVGLTKDRNDKARERASAQQDLALEMAILQAKTAAGGRESDLVDNLEDELSVLQLQKSLKESMHLTDDEALTQAQAKVKAARDLADADKSRHQAQSNVDRLTTAAIDHARAHHHVTHADRLERAAAVDKATEDIRKSNPKMDPAEARRQAEMHQRDLDRLHGHSIIHGAAPPPVSNGLEDFYKRNPGLYRDPGHAAATNLAQQKATRTAHSAAIAAQRQARQNGGGSADQLLQDAVTELKAMNAKFTVLN